MKTRWLVGALGVALTVAACGGGAGGSPSGGPTPGPTSGSSNDTGVIAHRTGSRDVILRFEQGGGFVPIGFLATQAPQFTLYGDGTVIFRDTGAGVPGNSEVGALAPYRTAHLSEPEMQAFLRFAITDGGIGVAAAAYSPGNVADAPTSIFTLHAGGIDKSVHVDALGFENPHSPDAAMLKVLAALGARITAFGGTVPGAAIWNPDRWRGILTPGSPGPHIAWPWSDITPADFVQLTGPDDPRFPIDTLDAAHVAALHLTGIEGGFSALALTGPDGSAPYMLALRPLLPDEVR